MCVISCILKMIVSIINSLLMIMGIVLMVLGALLLWGMNLIIKGVYDLQTEMEKFFKAINVNANASGIISLVQQNSSTLGAVAFTIGIVLVAIAILGIIAVCCCSLKRLLIVICIVLILITLGLIVFIIIFGANQTNQIFDPIVSFLQTKIINKYRDINTTEPESMIVNVVQAAGHCCGLFNYTDFNSAKNFNRDAIDSKNQKHYLLFPISCCNYNNDMTITLENRDKCIQTNSSIAMNKGCYSQAYPHIVRYVNYAFTTIGITIGVLVGTIVVTIILIHCADKLE